MDLPLGVIEGFFGRPWGNAARWAYAEFLRARGFGYYIYAPKAERKLRKAWRDRLATEEVRTLADLATRYRTCGLKFGIGLTPFELHLDYSWQSKSALRSKIGQLNEIGVDILCVLFDDMHGAVPRLAQLQARVVADISSWTSAATLYFCPTYYSDDPVLGRVFGTPPAHYLEDLGRELDPAVGVFWTGEKVCSATYPDQHLIQVAERLGRRPVIWDNHIANDARDRCAHLYLDAFANGWALHPQLAAGLVINPMNQPWLSRIPLAACAQLAGPRETFATLARSVCGDGLGQALLASLDLLQFGGLSGLDAATRARLLAIFQAYEPDGAATELVDWLRDRYAFDPQCLTE
jgi:hypothetical protein